VTDPLAADETRIDRWLCAVRLVKTRPLATRLCEAGHVLVNGSPAKPSTKVRGGDRVEALITDRTRIIEVLRPIESRVGAAVAATCCVDHSPPVVPKAGPEIMPTPEPEGFAHRRPLPPRRPKARGLAVGDARQASGVLMSQNRAMSVVRTLQRPRSWRGRAVRSRLQ
jgi:ribosome-associated heat shock protein Hsp15